ncbi:MAG: PAS domain S-box protein [Deltaproteobacteria bacterium]|nr:PAS domain S-box protein [Deltaproteobacteria bacterium]
MNGPLRAARAAASQLVNSIVVRAFARVTGRSVTPIEARMFDDMSNDSLLGMVLIDLDGTILRANAAFERMIERDVRGVRFAEITHPDDLEENLSLLRDVLAGRRRSYSLRKRYLRADGTVVHARTTATFVHGPDDRPRFGVAIVEDITDKVRAEQAMRDEASDARRAFRDIEQQIAQTREFLAAIIDHLPIALIAKDARDHRFILWNRVSEALFGRSAAEVLGKTDFDFFPREQAEFFVTKDRETLAGRVMVEIPEEPADTAAGRRWLRTRKVPIANESGAPQSLLVMCEDITERRAAELALRESRAQIELLAKVASQTNSAVMISDPDGTIRWVNDAFMRVTGYGAAELLGRHPAEILSGPDGDRRAVVEIERQLAETGRFDVECLLYTKSGRSFWGEVRGEPLLDDAGNVTSVVSVQTDITARKRGEQERQLLHEIAVAIGEAADLPSALGLVLRKVCDTTGWVIGQAWMPAGAAELSCLATWYARDAGGEEFHAESLAMRFTRGRGLPGTVWASAQPVWIRDAAAEPGFLRRSRAIDANLHAALAVPVLAGPEVVAVLEFLMRAAREEDERLVEVIGAVAAQLGAAIQRKRAEDALRVSRDELRAANEALARAARTKDDFLASMSHELRTPLTGILSLSEALQDRIFGPLDERQQRALRTIEESGRHLLELINDVLDLSKTEAGRMELHLEPCALEPLAEASLRLVKQSATAKQQTLEIEVQPRDVVTRADPRRLKQILVNLLSNAVKFTPEGKRIGVEVVGDRAAGVVRLTVRDEGIGIAPEHVPRLFQSFVQLDSRLSRAYSGTGLGLALVRRMTELHGGSVSLESAPGAGSRFTVTLPWSESDDSDPPVSSREAELPAADGAPRNVGRRVLLADDHDVNRATIGAYLEARGYVIISARDGAEAVRLARDALPDIILLDVQMPVLDGLQAMRRIREEPLTTMLPIVVLTALVMPGDRERCLAAGANDYIAKPVPLRTLVAAIERHLRRATA